MSYRGQSSAAPCRERSVPRPQPEASNRGGSSRPSALRRPPSQTSPEASPVITEATMRELQELTSALKQRTEPTPRPAPAPPPSRKARLVDLLKPISYTGSSSRRGSSSSASSWNGGPQTPVQEVDSEDDEDDDEPEICSMALPVGPSDEAIQELSRNRRLEIEAFGDDNSEEQGEAAIISDDEEDIQPVNSSEIEDAFRGTDVREASWYRSGSAQGDGNTTKPDSEPVSAMAVDESKDTAADEHSDGEVSTPTSVSTSHVGGGKPAQETETNTQTETTAMEVDGESAGDVRMSEPQLGIETGVGTEKPTQAVEPQLQVEGSLSSPLPAANPNTMTMAPQAMSKAAMLALATPKASLKASPVPPKKRLSISVLCPDKLLKKLDTPGKLSKETICEKSGCEVEILDDRHFVLAAPKTNQGPVVAAGYCRSVKLSGDSQKAFFLGVGALVEITAQIAEEEKGARQGGAQSAFAAQEEGKFLLRLAFSEAHSEEVLADEQVDKAIQSSGARVVVGKDGRGSRLVYLSGDKKQLRLASASLVSQALKASGKVVAKPKALQEPPNKHLVAKASMLLPPCLSTPQESPPISGAVPRAIPSSTTAATPSHSEPTVSGRTEPAASPVFSSASAATLRPRATAAKSSSPSTLQTAQVPGLAPRSPSPSTPTTPSEPAQAPQPPQPLQPQPQAQPPASPPTTTPAPQPAKPMPKKPMMPIGARVSSVGAPASTWKPRCPPRPSNPAKAAAIASALKSVQKALAPTFSPSAPAEALDAITKSASPIIASPPSPTEPATVLPVTASPKASAPAAAPTNASTAAAAAAAAAAEEETMAASLSPPLQEPPGSLTGKPSLSLQLTEQIQRLQPKASSILEKLPEQKQPQEEKALSNQPRIPEAPFSERIPYLTPTKTGVADQPKETEAEELQQPQLQQPQAEQAEQPKQETHPQQTHQKSQPPAILLRPQKSRQLPQAVQGTSRPVHAQTRATTLPIMINGRIVNPWPATPSLGRQSNQHHQQHHHQHQETPQQQQQSQSAWPQVQDRHDGDEEQQQQELLQQQASPQRVAPEAKMATKMDTSSNDVGTESASPALAPDAFVGGQHQEQSAVTAGSSSSGSSHTSVPLSVPSHSQATTGAALRPRIKLNESTPDQRAKETEELKASMRLLEQQLRSGAGGGTFQQEQQEQHRGYPSRDGEEDEAAMSRHSKYRAVDMTARRRGGDFVGEKSSYTGRQSRASPSRKDEQHQPQQQEHNQQQQQQQQHQHQQQQPQPGEAGNEPGEAACPLKSASKSRSRSKSRSPRLDEWMKGWKNDGDGGRDRPRDEDKHKDRDRDRDAESARGSEDGRRRGGSWGRGESWWKDWRSDDKGSSQWKSRGNSWKSWWSSKDGDAEKDWKNTAKEEDDKSKPYRSWKKEGWSSSSHDKDTWWKADSNNQEASQSKDDNKSWGQVQEQSPQQSSPAQPAAPPPLRPESSIAPHPPQTVPPPLQSSSSSSSSQPYLSPEARMTAAELVATALPKSVAMVHLPQPTPNAPNQSHKWEQAHHPHQSHGSSELSGSSPSQPGMLSPAAAAAAAAAPAAALPIVPPKAAALTPAASWNVQAAAASRQANSSPTPFLVPPLLRPAAPGNSVHYAVAAAAALASAAMSAPASPTMAAASAPVASATAATTSQTSYPAKALRPSAPTAEPAEAAKSAPGHTAAARSQSASSFAAVAASSKLGQATAPKASTASMSAVARTGPTAGKRKIVGAIGALTKVRKT